MPLPCLPNLGLRISEKVQKQNAVYSKNFAAKIFAGQALKVSFRRE
jgi:hypothetical protein